MQFEDLRLFVATINEQSFTAAAEKLGLSKQYVSRRTMALEEELGVRLLNRTTRSLKPTDLGMTLYERAVQILDDVNETQELVSSQGVNVRGTLRVSAPMTFGTLHISPLLPKFMQENPLINLELDLNDRAVDLVAEGYDMGIRGGILEDSTLIAKRLMDIPMAACASPEYLKQHSTPETPDDLRHHECLLYGHVKSVEWKFQTQGQLVCVPVKGKLRTNNGEVVRDAAVAGLGIAYLPVFIVNNALNDGRLVPVLQAHQPPTSAFYAVYPQHRQSSRAVQAFANFLREHLAV
ncbi:LysR family transcriptional regulator [Pseudomonas asuensis]|jgi:DNA-binding transcriptional LysR family regulator|uniref:LysR family transcriptional regulator n=1 Tax=Pseudomonas asuensis TaxID=1825787 RepID=A0ABQ2GXG8_9PSED|nr:LysR family transcriptional regulator [Pseudomonas asuensis]GGM16454.1 LysR family transcriptional regulator [Pseudomonas asuensis]